MALPSGLQIEPAGYLKTFLGVSYSKLCITIELVCTQHIKHLLDLPGIADMSSSNPVQEALEQAQKAFRKKLQDPRLYEEILATTTIDDVYKETSKIQANIAPSGKLRHLAKIKPLLDRLSEYALVIEVFIQVKPDLLALIWGPIKIILMWSSQINAVFDKVADTLATIGHALPQFAVMAQTFETSDVVKAALALFYEDILDFYGIAFELFRKTRWKQLFHIIWAGYQTKINVVLSNLEKHSLLMRSEVTFLDIKEAREARIQSSKHFTQAEGFQERQKYNGLKSRVTPNLYDDRLDWLRNRCVSGCDTWLFRDEEFCEWLDNSKNTIVWLWLQGIPGAGKTYLTAKAIDYTREQHRTLFAFAAYLNKGSLCALSIIQSLIFQAAEDDRDFQSLLVESKERELQGNTGYVVGLLKTFLLTAGPTYIIIDGLDEMEEFERQILLHQLNELSKECEDLRLLISSRAEDDIDRMLQHKATRIRVDIRNSGSIQAYVNRRCQDWVINHQLNPDTKSELLGLLSPLSAKANGMFLYARIIMDNLEQMSSIEEIRRELKALPNDLTDAYHRIFHRINEARPQLRNKCRRVLGWIGCAPIPLTVLEMEQALSIDFNSEEPSELPQLITNINFVQMCGPIIEVADEKLQYVHFTVHDREIRNYIDKATATRQLTMSFVAYLGSNVMDVDLDDEDIHENILAGKYRLLEYASFFWPKLIQQTNDGDEVSHRLRNLLDGVIQQGRNYGFKRTTDLPEPLYKNIPLQLKSPEVLTMVCETFQFHLDDKRWDWNWSNSDSWVNLDPLTTSQMLVRIQEQHKTLVLDPAHVASLRFHYGTRLFRCTYAFCEHSYRGFETKRDRDAHVNNHGKPWKCSIPNCDFSTIGFSSKTRRDQHWLKVHLPAPSQFETGLDDFENLDVAEAQPILFALVIEDDADGARRLLSAPGGKKLNAEVIASARCLAAKEGYLAMTQLLAPVDETYSPQIIVKYAIQSGDVDFAKWAISKTRPEDCAKNMKVALSTKLEEIYDLWEEYLLKMPRMVPKPSTDEDKDLFKELFNRTLFNEINNNPLGEARVKHTLKKLRGSMDSSLLGHILVSIAKSSCSIHLAEKLLVLGAPIDYPRGYKSTGMTALHVAARKTTREAALFMKWLILKGASPVTSIGYAQDLGNLKGAKVIAEWVGMTWEELRDQYLKSV
ncbi:hypothetical protein G7Z17_g2472 [Cylindrodendrum hubeiense]|uniref:NACHT domain-containing protein n=1 Tax=Cylindrodendrum hubeiense TaxID=595255 RepID=A0A9P5HHJ5_9HYPO|nr:hypothetical protein G7Z17_g2472 [Cylindrodendrum hubeiense]